MAPQIHDLKRYLLGDLDPTCAEAIDHFILGDPSCEPALTYAESELIEGYLDGTLDERDRTLFQQNFLVSDNRRHQLQQTMLLRDLALQTEPAAVRTAPLKSNVACAGVGSRPRARSVVIAAGVLVLLLAGASSLIIYFAHGRIALERQYSELNRADLSNLSRVGEFSKIELLPGTYRDAGSSPNRLALETLSEIVLFRLPLTYEPGSRASFDADLRHDGESIFTVRDLTAYQDNGVKEIRVLIPRSLFKKAEYQIRLTEFGSQTSSVIYSFTAN